jgi:hypothetical protein
MDIAIVILLVALVCLMVYMVFDPKDWLDKYCNDEKNRWGKEEPLEEPEGPVKSSQPKKKRKYTKRKKKK